MTPPTTAHDRLKWRIQTLIGAITLCWFSVAQGMLAIKDDAGHLLKLAQPAQRVITLTPSLTEMVYAAGGGKKLIATVSYSDYPEAARKLPRIGDAFSLDIERIAALKPDLIFVWQHGNAERQLAQLKELGIPIFTIQTQRVADIPPTLERIGQLLGTTQEARTAANAYHKSYAELIARYKHTTPLRVFFQIDSQPLLSINDQHIIADAIRICGGQNVFADQRALIPLLTREGVVNAAPQIMLTAVPHLPNEQAQRNPTVTAFQTWQTFTSIPAVRNKQMWLIPANLISRSSPRIVEGAAAICEALQSARKQRTP